MDADYFSSVFGSAPDATGVAPGRIEFIGNHTDYNGGLVMGASVNLGVRVDIARNNEGVFKLHSKDASESVVEKIDSISRKDGKQSWANYALGVIDQFNKADMKINSGLNIAVTSDLPAGAGMSSSAAFELATACAVAKLFNYNLDRKELAKIGRRAENEFVGLPCGLLDQGVSAFGDVNHLVKIDCFTETFNTVPMPSGVQFWIFNTQKKHALLDSLYSTRFNECKFAFETLKTVLPDIQCLAQVHPDDIVKYGSLMSADIFARALHVTEENDRVRSVANSLACNDISEVGRLLSASHQSSRRLFMNSCEELDFLVERLNNMEGVYGARLTGGGFGGAVMAMTNETFGSTGGSEKLVVRYENRFRNKPTIIQVKLGPGARAL